MTQTNNDQLLSARHVSRPRYQLTRRGRVVFTLLPLLLIGAIGLAAARGSDLNLEGVDDEAMLGADQAELTIRVLTEADPERITATLDENEIELGAVSEGELTAILGDISDGEHTFRVVVDRTFPFPALEESRTFTLDTTPPAVEVLTPLEPVPVGSEVTVSARVNDDAAQVVINGEPVEPDVDGIVAVSFDEPPDSVVSIVATDALGNVGEYSIPVELALAGSPGGPPMVGVHATGYTWTTPVLKDPIVEMIESGLINTVQLDLKDEAGQIWYDTGVQLAHDAGAVTILWNLEEVVDELHGLGVRVVGRIVNFRDPILAAHAVETGRTDWVIQNPDGTAYGQYGGFTNPFNVEVREYNMALAEEAARLGVDDIMYDYVRRPDTLSELVYPGQDGEPEDAIVSFLAESYPRVNESGARLGAAVFGIAATRPEEVAQDIPRMSEHLDYVAPMVYPSHWGPGEYGVDDPNNQPYDITLRSLEDFMELTSGTQAGIVSWLQDFSLGVDYGPEEVRAQIQASRDAGVTNILLWDAATTYTRAALDPLE